MLQTLTTWVNKVLKDTDAESVVDLRKCVGDGVTLVKLAEKTCKCMHVQEVIKCCTLMLNYLVDITNFQMIIFRLRSHLLNLKVLPPHSEIICLLVFLFATQIV